LGPHETAHSDARARRGERFESTTISVAPAPFSTPSAPANIPPAPVSSRSRERISLERAPKVALEAPAALSAPLQLFAVEGLDAVFLSWIAGFVDASGFVALVGLFPAHITGEIVAITSEFPQGGPRLLERLAVMAAFIVAVVLTAAVARVLRARRAPVLAGLLVLMTLVLGSFSVLGAVLRPFANSAHAWVVPALSCCAVAAMGVQNTVMREGVLDCCPTTVMTGNLTQVLIEAVGAFFPESTRPRPQQTYVRALRGARGLVAGVALLGFIFGATTGAWLTSAFGLVSIGIPTLATAGLAWAAWRSRRPH
jgi:uncharacterized membrane protein YoaK (UPF0700 family)